MPDALTTDTAAPTVVAPALAPGARIADRYRLVERLGAGGGGTVWRCVDEQLAATVALKILDASGDVDRWRREVAMARRIGHRNVCRVHDLGEAGELRFVTMELVEGRSLRAHIRVDLPATDARALLEQIIAGAAAIHAAGIVHRDLKPENVVVASDGRAVIVDFGLAREPRRDDPAAPQARAAYDHDNAGPDAGVTVPTTPRARQAVRDDAGASHDRAEPSAGGSKNATVPQTPRAREVGEADARAREAIEAGQAGATVPQTPRAREAGDAARAIAPRPAGAEPRLPMVTAAGVVVGTPRYMSPEQAAGETVDARTDVWALGLIAHELLAGVLPAGDRVTDAAAAKWPGAAAKIRICLARKPIDRYVDARALQLALAPRRSRWRWPVVIGGVVLGGAAIAIVVARGEPAPPPRPQPFAMLQLTTTSPKDWPAGAPASVALAPDATRFAYTTGAGKLFVRELAGGTPRPWPVPTYGNHARAYASVAVAGWFRDGSVAVIAGGDDGWHLLRLRETGAPEQLLVRPTRMRAAIAPDDRIAIAVAGGDVGVIGQPALAHASTDSPLALAWSPDGTRLAYASAAASGDATLVVLGAGAQPVPLWHSHTTFDPVLAWVGDNRLAFAFGDDTHAQLVGIDVATGEITQRQRWAGEVVTAGSGARGTVLLLRGPAPVAVQIRTDYTARGMVAATRVAGWLGDDKLVVGVDDRVAIATRPADRHAPWPTAPWSGTQPGDIPVTVVGDSVIVRVGHDFIRLDAGGSRTQLVRGDAMACGGTTCLIAQGTDWYTFDRDGELGDLVHAGGTAALSRDGALLAVVDGSDQIGIVDRASGVALPKPLTVAGASLRAVAFGDAGDLYAAGLDVRGHPFALAIVHHHDGGGAYTSAWPASTDPLRWFGAPVPHSSNDKTAELAVPIRDLHLEIWRADGI